MNSEPVVLLGKLCGLLQVPLATYKARRTWGP